MCPPTPSRLWRLDQCQWTINRFLARVLLLSHGGFYPLFCCVCGDNVQGYTEHVSTPSELPMLDLVLGVRDSEQWHKMNLDR